MVSTTSVTSFDEFEVGSDEEFGMATRQGATKPEATREAVIGLAWLVVKLSVGHPMLIHHTELDGMMAGRRDQLRNRAR